MRGGNVAAHLRNVAAGLQLGAGTSKIASFGRS